MPTIERPTTTRGARTAPAREAAGPDPSRRGFLLAGGLGIALAAAACAPGPTPGPSAPDTSGLLADLGSLEQTSGVSIGLYAEDVVTGRAVSHRAADPFPMCSLFKVLAVAAAMRAHPPYDGDYWQTGILFTPDDLVVDSPVTSATTTWVMTPSELADAALRYSDNTAGNLLLRELGGPGSVTELARSLGATSTRLDRWEPELNEATPGDARDTTTPGDVALLYRQLLVDDTLGMLGQARLRDWMLRNTTSGKRLRAATGVGTEVADKTGAGAYGVVNDAGVVWRADGHPVVVAVLTRTDDPAAENDSTVVATAAGLALGELAR